MLVVVTYDVNTETKEGRRRLRKVAEACKNFGQRVQLSVFECVVNDTQLVRLRAHLLKLIDKSKDSVRIYLLDEAARKRIEHYGISGAVDFETSLQV
jgi:CRISPR-associated protein Cas2